MTAAPIAQAQASTIATSPDRARPEPLMTGVSAPARRPGAKQKAQKQARKPSAKSRKRHSGTGSNLPEARGVDFEKNSSGGFEAWHVPAGVTHRRDKRYLGYVGKKLLS